MGLEIENCKEMNSKDLRSPKPTPKDPFFLAARFSPIESGLGGMMIGASAAMAYLIDGKITGISGSFVKETETKRWPVDALLKLVGLNFLLFKMAIFVLFDSKI